MDANTKVSVPVLPLYEALNRLNEAVFTLEGVETVRSLAQLAHDQIKNALGTVKGLPAPGSLWLVDPPCGHKYTLPNKPGDLKNTMCEIDACGRAQVGADVRQI